MFSCLVRAVDISRWICSANNPQNCTECLRNPCLWCENTKRCVSDRIELTCFSMLKTTQSFTPTTKTLSSLISGYCRVLSSEQSSTGVTPNSDIQKTINKALIIGIPLAIGLIALVVGIVVAVYWTR